MNYSEHDKYLVSTVFPLYDIPYKLWESRLKTLMLAGFNCVDVRLIWSEHEAENGEWDFSENKNVPKFFRLCKKLGLLVVVCPGAHVDLIRDHCGVPLRLLSKSQNVAYFGDEGELWFVKILSMIKEYQNAPVISILFVASKGRDFDEEAGLSALNLLAKRSGITIPVYTSEIRVNENFIPSASTFELKRQLIKGERKLTAKWFVGGVRPGLSGGYASVRNNGPFGAFTAFAFDYDCIISPFGEINNALFTETRLLKMFLDTFSAVLLNGRPKLDTKITASVSGNSESLELAEFLLSDGDGSIISCANNSYSDDLYMTILDPTGAFPQKSEIYLPPRSCRYVLRNYILNQIGANFTVRHCTSEILYYKRVGELIYIIVAAQSESEFCVTGNNITVISSTMQNSLSDDTLIVCFSDESEIKFSVGGALIRVIAINKNSASKSASIDKHGIISCVEYDDKDLRRSISAKKLNISMSELPSARAFTEISMQNANYMEKNGIFGGFAVYEADVTLPPDFSGADALGIILSRAADVASVFVNGDYIATEIPFGSHVFIESYGIGYESVNGQQFEIPVRRIQPLRDGLNTIRVKTEIWGHSFAEFEKIHSLSYRSEKGLRSVSVAVSKERIPPACVVTPKQNIPNASYGIYANGSAKVFVNGKLVSSFRNYYDYVDISPFIKPRQDNQIAIDGRVNGEIYFIKGIRASAYRIAKLGEAELLSALNNPVETIRTSLPAELLPGHEKFISFMLPTALFHDKRSYKAVFSGRGIKITAFFGGKVMGRLWLPNADDNAPDILYGSPDTVYLPYTMFERETDTRLSVFVEAVSHDGCVLENVEFVEIH